MVQLIAFIIFILSLAGFCFMLYKKIPVLVQLPQNGHHGFKKSEFVLNVEKKLKDFHFDLFKKQVFLHKVLSKCRILILKIEKKIDVLLHGIRKKAQELEKENGKK
mgnify:CR=1 FL=1